MRSHVNSRRPLSLTRRRRALPLRMERLEDRTAPSTVTVDPAELRRRSVITLDQPMAALPTLVDAPPANPAFDAAGRALVGNKSRISDPLLRLFNALQDQAAGRSPVDFPSAERLQVDTSGAVMVSITGLDINALERALHGIGFRTLGSAPAQHLIEGWLPVGALPQAEALASQGLFGIVPIRRPGTSVGLVTSQADFVHESDRVRLTDVPPFINGFGVEIGVLSDSFATRVAPITTAAQDVANGDLPVVAVLQEGPAASSDEGRAMLQLIHDMAPGAALSFASAFFGQVDFGNQIKALQAAGASVIVDDIFYFEEPQYQDGVIAQAITDVVNNKNVAYFSSAGNNGTQAFESVGWTETNADPFATRLFDFDPGAGVDARQRVTIPLGGSVNITFQWDDPFFTAAGVDTDMDIFLLRADTGAIVASGTDVNPTTKVPSENFGFNNATGQTAFDIVVRRFSGPNPGRFKWVNLNSFLTIDQFDTGLAGSITPHAAAIECEGVGAIPYFDQTGIEGFTSRGPNVVVFDTVGNPIAPQNRVGVYIAAIDGVNNTFFGGDTEGDGFPNFFGTSAAAPNAAAIAAMFRQANPTVTNPFSVYSALEGTADASVFTPGFDNRTGAGLVNAYDAVVGFTQARESVLTDGFESGLLGRFWETRTTGAGRIEVSNANGPATGFLHVTLDSERDGFDSLNELTLRANLANVNNAVLTFQQKEFNDEDNPMPASFVGSGNFDGVAMSVDGVNWFRLVDLTGANSTNAYQSFSINLNKVAADNGLALNSNTRIKFQQFDNFGIPTDGFAFDDVRILRSGTISGISYDDLTANGIRDGADPGRPGQIVYEDANFNNRFDYDNAITFTSPQLPQAIRDLTTIRVPLTVSGFGGTVSDVDVSIDLTHTWDADLDITLIAPNGTRVLLSDDNGGSDDNYTGTTFDDEAATLITAGVAPFTGRFIPEGFLGALDGVALSGTWYLEVTDDVGADVGTVNSWSLTLSRSFASTDTPIATIDNGTINSNRVVSGLAGKVSDVNVTVNINHDFLFALDIFLVSPGGTLVELSTDNGGGAGSYTATTFDDEAATPIAGGASPFFGRFVPEGSLAALDGIDPNGTWTLRVIDDDAFGDTGQLVSWTLELGRSFSQDNPPVAVPDPGTITTNLPVAGLTGPIVDVEVNLNLTQTFNADFDVFLTSPAGTKVELFTDVGGSSDNFFDLTLDDAATLPLSVGTGPFSGRFRPEGLLSAFNGESGNGTWTLEVTDDLVIFPGTIVDWSVTLHTAATAANTTPVAINDLKTSFSSVFFTGVSGNVNDVNVTLDLTHTWDSDLDIYLIGPGGVRVELTTDNGGSADNYTKTTFDDEANTGIESGVAPFTGKFRPEGQLSLFDGIDPNGSWFLEISDDVGADTGTLNSWSITLTTGELHAITGAKGEYTLPNLAAGTHRIREVLPPGRYHTEPVPDTYVLTLDNGGTSSLVGRDFGSDADNTGPTASILAVTPNPRNTPVPSMTIAFSEPVTGLDLADLTLTRDGGANLLTGFESLTSIDGGRTWTLGGLAALTGVGGVYTMSMDGTGAGIVDRALNGYSGFEFQQFTVDVTAPTVVSIVRADTNPNGSASVNWTVTFSEPVVGVAAANFSLVPGGGLGGAPAITGVAGLGAVWTVTASTGIGKGTLGLNLTAAGAVADLATNPLGGLPFVGEVYNILPEPRVASVVINGGAGQRSRVTSIQIDFDQLVTLPGAPEAAFQLKRQSDNAPVTLSAAVVNTTFTRVTLTFTGGAIDGPLAPFNPPFSLADGRYTLTAFAASITGATGQLDGNNDGTGGDNFVLVGNPLTNRLHRIFGDSDGDGDVDATDYGAFRGAFGAPSAIFDIENDGDVDAADYGQFRGRFGTSI